MKKNYIYNLSLSVVNILFPIVSFPYASHLLGPTGIGKVQFIVSFAMYFSLTAALGIPIYGINETAKAKTDKKALSLVFSELTTIYCITSLLLTALYCLVIYTVPFFEASRPLYLYAGIIVLISFFYLDWFYSGIEAFGLITLRSVVVKLLSLVGLYFFVKTATDYKQYLLITIFSITGNNIISFFMIGRNTSFTFSGLNLYKHLKPLLYIFSTTVAASIYTYLDTVLLGFLSGDHAVGLYTAGVKLTRVVLPLVTAIGAVAVPRITTAMHEGNFSTTQEILDRAFHFVVLLSVPSMVGLMAMAPEFILVFSGQQFAAATTCMQILAALPVLVGFGYFFAFLVLVPGGKNKEMFLSVAAGVIVFFLLNFLLVPFFRETGTAIANIATELIVTLLYFYFARKHFSFTYKWKAFFPAIICSALFFPIVKMFRLLSLNIFVFIGVTAAACAIVYMCGQLFIFRNQLLVNAATQTYRRIPFIRKKNN